MKKFLVAMGLVAFAVVGCDDSSSASAENNEPAALSSAEKQGSSSSSRHCEECNDEAISLSFVFFGLLYLVRNDIFL